MRKLNVATVIVTAVALGLLPSADAKLASRGDASVSFTGIGPAGLKITGSTTDLSVADDGKNVTITVPLKNLTTGIGVRDKHMHEKYLQTDQYRTAELVVDRAALKFPAGAESSANATGTMTLHGKSRPVTFHYTATPAGGALKVFGRTDVNMNDFGIVVPTYLGVTMKPNISVVATFTATN